MAVPMTAPQLIRQLDKWEVKYRKLPSFDDPNSGRDDETGLNFGPVFGFGIHHTGSDAADYINRKLIVEGRSDLPGPLAHFGGNDDGVIDLITIGRANHFGGGDPRVLEAVKAENYRKYPPKTHKHQGSPGAADGNDAFYGIECYYSGSRRMTEELYESVVLLGAAICDFHDWSAKSVIGHKEWSDWKPDPASHDMYEFRVDIDEALKAGPPSKRPDAPTRVTFARDSLSDAIRALEKAAEVRNSDKIEDVVAKLKMQRSRLPKR